MERERALSVHYLLQWHARILNGSFAMRLMVIYTGGQKFGIPNQFLVESHCMAKLFVLSQ